MYKCRTLCGNKNVQ